MKLFLTAFIQVALVSFNTYLISHNMIIGIFFASFLISYVWSGNVKKISVSNQLERIIYSSGAAFGGVVGYFLANLLNI